MVLPSPACHRALKTVVTSLEVAGHQIVTLCVLQRNHSPIYTKLIEYCLTPGTLRTHTKPLKSHPNYFWRTVVRYYSGFPRLPAHRPAGKTVLRPMRWGEWNDLGMVQAFRMFRVPSLVRHLYAWYLRHIRGDEVYAGLVENWCEKNVEEYYKLVAQREGYRAKWFDMWNREDLDFVLTVPSALPAVPHGGMKDGWKACGYTFLFNLVRLGFSLSRCHIFTHDGLLDIAGLLGWRTPNNTRRSGPGRCVQCETPKCH